jgi:hypothetical protein
MNKNNTNLTNISCIPAKNVVPGRLYYFKGAVVRAGRKTSNDLRHISFHKQLHGFVKDEELFLVNKTGITQYLQNA